MVKEINRDEVQRLVGAGAQLVEVLPSAEYEWMHLPGAIHSPLVKLTPERAARLKKNDPVIVYCHDTQ